MGDTASSGSAALLLVQIEHPGIGSEHPDAAGEPAHTWEAMTALGEQVGGELPPPGPEPDLLWVSRPAAGGAGNAACGRPRRTEPGRCSPSTGHGALAR